MKEIRLILFATDLSEGSVQAAEYALTLATLAGARLHILHVLGEFADRRKSRIQPGAFAIMQREMEVNAVRELEEFCRDRFAGRTPYTTEILLGLPFQVILKRIGELHPDLVVMGTHGRLALEKVVLGSTAERVISKSPVPVLTVRHPAR